MAMAHPTLRRRCAEASLVSLAALRVHPVRAMKSTLGSALAAEYTTDPLSANAASGAHACIRAWSSARQKLNTGWSTLRPMHLRWYAIEAGACSTTDTINTNAHMAPHCVIDSACRR